MENKPARRGRPPSDGKPSNYSSTQRKVNSEAYDNPNFSQQKQNSWTEQKRPSGPKKYIVDRNNQTITLQAGVWYEDEIWKDSVIRFIKELISEHILNDPETETIKNSFFNFLDENPINCLDFYKVFVSQTYDPVYNYENLEKMGDTAIKLAFTRFVYIKNVKDNLNMDAAAVNNYVSTYLSKGSFGVLAKDKLKINSKNIILFNGTESMSMFEDVFESFCGALLSIGEMFSSGFGYFMCQRFAETMTNPEFLNLTFSLEEKQEAVPPFTWIKEIYDTIGRAEGDSYEEKNGVILTVTDQDTISYRFEITKSVKKIIEKYLSGGIKLDDNLVVYETGFLDNTPDNLQILNNECASKAREFLVNNGFDDEFILRLKLGKRRNRLEYNGLDVRKLDKKIKDNNILGLETKENRNSSLMILNEITKVNGEFKYKTVMVRPFTKRTKKEDEIALFNDYLKDV